MNVSLLCLALFAAPSVEQTGAQDLYFFGPDRLFIIRLVALRAGQPLAADWGDFLYETFERTDADGNFELDYTEFQRGDWDDVSLRQAGSGLSTGGGISFLDFDCNPRDNVISFDEFVALLGSGFCRVTYASARQVTLTGQQAQPADPLWSILADKEDAPLKLEEITDPFAKLRWLDADDDELFSAAELQPNRNPLQNQPLSASRVIMGSDSSPSSPLLAPVPGTPPLAVARHFRESLDRDQSGGLSIDELRPHDAFADGDANHNGTVDDAELADWLARRSPDLEVRIRLDAKLDAPSRVELVRYLESDAARLHQNGSMITVSLPNAQIQLTGEGPRDPKEALAEIEKRFKGADRDNNGYLDPQEGRQYGGLGRFFHRIDIDRDKQVFPKELVAYLEAKRSAVERRADVEISNRGSTLLEILDDGDGQLSRRELRDLARRADAWDGDGDGELTSNEIPRQFQIKVAPGRVNLLQTSVVQVFGAPGVRTTNRPARGPGWFGRMDRNGDGDLSPREFLGPTADFTKLDSNGDGLIDPEEAARAPER